MIGRAHGFLFVHIPKTGGNSIAQALLPYADDEVTTERPGQDGTDRFGLRVEGTRLVKHSPIADYVAELGLDVVRALTVFTVVRDPWSRALSSFYSPQRDQRGWDRQAFIEHVEERVTPMVSYLTVDGSPSAGSLDELAVDVVLDFDALAAEFASLTRTLGLTAELGVRNSSRRPPVEEVYDDELDELVAERFAADIELFGFTPPATSGRRTRGR